MSREPFSPKLDEELERELEDYSRTLDLAQDSLERLKAEISNISERSESKSPGLKGWFSLRGLSLASAAVVVLFSVSRPFLSPPGHRPVKNKSDLSLIPKGFSLDCWAISRATHFKKKVRVKQGEILFKGDQIKFVYASSEPKHVMIASIDRKGNPAIFIQKGLKSIQLEKGIGVFPALEMDDYVGPERIIVLTSTRSFTVKQVKRAIKKAFSKAKGDLQRLKQIPGPWKTSWTRLIQKRL